jgi:hypothetical protein
MSVTLVMTVLGTAGVAFYLRFLVPLCQESKPQVGSYWVHLRLKSEEDLIAAQKEREIVVSRAA